MPPGEREARFTDIRALSPTTRHFVLEILGPERFDYLPGQFASFLLPIPAQDPVRPYSIASPPSGANRIELCLNRIQDGAGSAYLFEQEPGAPVRFTGPWGTFVIRGPSAAPKAFIATGTGIAPVRAQLRWLLERGFQGEAWLFFGVRNEQEILYHEEWVALAGEHPNLRYVPTLSRPGVSWAGHRGRVQVQLEKYLLNRTDMEFYLCGGKAMIEDVQGILSAWGVERKRVKFEKFD